MQIVNFILFILSFLLGGGLVIAIIRSDIKKKNYTDFIIGMYLQRWNGPDKISENRAIQMIWKIKEYYPEVNIDKTVRIFINEGYVIK